MDRGDGEGVQRGGCLRRRWSKQPPGTVQLGSANLEDVNPAITVLVFACGVMTTVGIICDLPQSQNEIC